MLGQAEKGFQNFLVYYSLAIDDIYKIFPNPPIYILHEKLISWDTTQNKFKSSYAKLKCFHFRKLFSF